MMFKMGWVLVLGFTTHTFAIPTAPSQDTPFSLSQGPIRESVAFPPQIDCNGFDTRPFFPESLATAIGHRAGGVDSGHLWCLGFESAELTHVNGCEEWHTQPVQGQDSVRFVNAADQSLCATAKSVTLRNATSEEGRGRECQWDTAWAHEGSYAFFTIRNVASRKFLAPIAEYPGVSHNTSSPSDPWVCHRCVASDSMSPPNGADFLYSTNPDLGQSRFMLLNATLLQSRDVELTNADVIVKRWSRFRPHLCNNYGYVVSSYEDSLGAGQRALCLDDNQTPVWVPTTPVSGEEAMELFHMVELARPGCQWKFSSTLSAFSMTNVRFPAAGKLCAQSQHPRMNQACPTDSSIWRLDLDA